MVKKTILLENYSKIARISLKILKNRTKGNGKFTGENAANRSEDFAQWV